MSADAGITRYERTNEMREFYISSSQKTEKLHCMIWEPENSPKAVVQISHGMVEHIARYAEFAEYLTKRGYVVAGHDHLGHGKTAKTETDLGFFARKNGHNIVIKDIHLVHKAVQKQYPGIPYILLGHSMGSYFARKYITIYGNEIDGVILSGTGNQPFAVAEAGYLISSLLVFFKGDHYRSRLMHSMMFGSFAKSVKERETDFDWLGKDKEKVAAYMADPFCQFKFTAGADRDFMKIITELCKKKRFDRIPKDLPVFLCAGEKDPVGSMGKGVVQVYETFGEIGMKNVTMKLYENDRHEILNEMDRDVVYQDMADWMEKICCKE